MKVGCILLEISWPIPYLENDIKYILWEDDRGSISLR